MAHPHKSEAANTHNAKLRHMTTHYGLASGPADNITAPSERLKGEAGEAHVGFGANSDAATSRSDRPARRSAAANPVATYARGGKVKHHEEEHCAGGMARKHGGRTKHHADGGKVPLPKPRPEGKEPDVGDLYTKEGADKLSNQRAQGGVIARARGGRAHGKHKGSTHVNVIVAPQGQAGAPPMAGPPPQLAGLMPKPPMAPPPMAGPPPGGPPMMPPPGPGGPPPMPMRARGGKVMGDHPDAAQDKELIEKTLREEGLIRKARGGGITMHAGAVTGIGRLEKMGKHPPLHKGSMTPKEI